MIGISTGKYMCNVVCVNWGNKYGPEYTYRLYNMVKRNTTKSFNFYCLTDVLKNYSEPIIPILLKPGLGGWWNKLQLFRDDILPKDEYLYLDLDVVIVRNIDCLFDWRGFGILRDFLNPDIGHIGGKEYNSSVMRFTQDLRLWKYFNNNHFIWNEYQKKIPIFSDQNVISAYLNKINFNNPFPDDWLWSYKFGVLRGGDRLITLNFLDLQSPRVEKYAYSMAGQTQKRSILNG